MRTYEKLVKSKRKERAYHPKVYDLLLMIKAIKKQNDVVIVRTKEVEGNRFPQIVVAGPIASLQNLEATYERLIERKYSDLTYDQIKAKKPAAIRHDQESEIEKILQENGLDSRGRLVESSI